MLVINKPRYINRFYLLKQEMLKTIVLLLLCTFALSVRQMAVTDRGLKIMNDPVLGNYLTDKDGKSLYVFDQDDNNMSNCYRNCTTMWPAFTVDAGITVYGNLTTSMLGMFIRDDGSNQLTFNQMPLYFYKLDLMSGDKNGQGIFGNGGYWYLVAPDGTPIMGNTATPAAPVMPADTTNPTLPDASVPTAPADATIPTDESNQPVPSTDSY